MKNTKIKILTLSLLAAIGLSFIGCDSNQFVSPNTANEVTLEQSQNVATNGTIARAALKTGPVSNEAAEAIEAPKERVTRKEGELNIIKAISSASLQKQFVATWFVERDESGWIYAGDESHGRTWLYFPRNAVPQDVYVTIDWESEGLLEGGVEFSPHGIEFQKDVTVWISYKDVDLGNINENDLKLWYWNEDDNVWELIGDTVDTDEKMVGGVLEHFSRYALGGE
ncbi:MAG: hypothetical protein DWQ05_05735 [Calditrichaeota bacterium]|nr:MAG: hypothetical protein DWQ05_05735 [Calditrichota bacterium]